MDKFYNRYEQLDLLTSITQNVVTTKGRLTVMVGRRRVGKTKLIKEHIKKTENAQRNDINKEGIKTLYFFISKKNQNQLVAEFSEIINHVLKVKFFAPKSLRDIFEFLFEYAKSQPLLLAIDEFQDITFIDNGLYSDLQNLWDSNKSESKIHLICCGSLYSMMFNLFQNNQEPLFNRHDHFIHINPLTPVYIKQIMQDNSIYTPDNYLMWWILSGGIPKYLEWLCQSKANPLEQLISHSSPLINEGMHRLIEDFGKQHRIYFAILHAISLGNTSRTRIEDFLKEGVGPHLQTLDLEFNIINKVRPITSKENSRDIRYQIKDPFLMFWFRFIYANWSAIEIGNFEYVKAIIKRDFHQFSGKALEDLFKAILVESKQYNRIGGYWDRKGENEIDLIAINDLKKTIEFIEVKRQLKHFNKTKLIQKANQALTVLNLSNYEVSFECFALDNIEQILGKYFLT